VHLDAAADFERRILTATSAGEAPTPEQIATAFPDRADPTRQKLAALYRGRRAEGWKVVAPPPSPPAPTCEPAQVAPAPAAAPAPVEWPPRPAVVDRLPFAEYQKIASVNWSSLKELRKSPLHYKWALEHPLKDTDTFAVGRATHLAVLEPERYEDEVVIWDGGARRGGDWTAFKAANAERTILKPEDDEACRAMAAAVRAHPAAGPLLVEGESEVTIRWTDPATGLKCKGRIDRVAPSLILDLKTAVEIEKRQFASQVAKLGYHCQLALYQRGFAEEHQGELRETAMIVVEKKPPHDVVVFRPDVDTMMAGAEEIDRLLALLVDCRAADRWPGRYPEPVDLQLPAWACERLDGMEVFVDGVQTEA
jgi:hypothetical protein